jgi:hypothetical protein
MEAKELRIGNFIYLKYEGLMQVVNINSQGFDYVDCIKPNYKHIGRYELQYLKPILLTEQCLLDFGFEKNIGIIRYFTIYNEVGEHYIFDLHTKTLSVGTIDNHYCFAWDVEYVHRLQNIIHPISGKELIYNPKQL